MKVEKLCEEKLDPILAYLGQKKMEFQMSQVNYML